MAKFSKQVQTVNRDGFPAYQMSDKEHLVTAVLTTMFGEPKYYGSTDSDIVRLATDCAKRDPEFLCNLAVYARNEFNMRSVSHVLTCVIAREASEYTRKTVRNVIVRADDILEIMACYETMYGKPWPNALKREVAEQLQRFDEYQLAKYNGGKRSITFKDVLRITHPTPANKEIEALFGKVLSDTLETPYTWETELSARGNTAEVWNELIASGKVGYMALLRNLRNIVKSGADIEPVLARIADPEQVAKSRQLPFRFFSAYRTLENDRLMTPEIHRALDAALTASVDNMETLAGRTLIAVDASGSMGCLVSRNSTVRCRDIAALFGAMASRICEDATVCFFDCEGGWSQFGGTGYKIVRFGKYDSVLDATLKGIYDHGGGTQMDLPLTYALKEDATRDLKPFDRVIYFSDNECNSSLYGLKTCQGLIDQYRREYNPDLWVHGVDLQGYGTQQFCGKNVNVIAGWSDKVLQFINLAETGVGTLVTTIEAYDADSVSAARAAKAADVAAKAADAAQSA